MMKQTWIFWFVGIVAFELLSLLVSLLVIQFPYTNDVVSLALALALLVLTIKKPTSALGILSVEYLIGSKGALFKFGGDTHNDGGVSIRILFFVAFFLGWLFLVWKHKTWRGWFDLLKSRFEYVLFAVLILYALLVGWLRQNSFLFVDANAWGALALLLPALDIVSQDKEAAKRMLVPAFTAGLLWLPFKTLTILYFFTRVGVGDMLSTDPFYLWIRQTGVGEITHLGGSAFRVFFQSHVYALFTTLGISSWFAFRGKNSRTLFFLLSFAFAEVITSLSRSLWIGLGAGFIFLGIYILRRKTAYVLPFLKNTLLGFVGGFALLFLALILVPPISHVSLVQFLGSRAEVSGASATSRWNLLPILWHKIEQHPISGSGFGATVTYLSADPRVVQRTGGVYTTYAFEWGWMDIWIKFGVFGVLALLYLLWRVGKRAWSADLPEWIRLAIMASLVALVATHVFTPYLNHPLGLFALITIEIVLSLKGTLAYDPARTHPLA